MPVTGFFPAAAARRIIASMWPDSSRSAGMLVVGYQQAAGRPRFFKQRQQRIQIPCRRPLPDHHPLPLADAFHRLPGRRTFVIVADAGGDIAIQRPAGKQRRVAVNPASMRMGGGNFRHHLRLFCQHPGVVHHLRQTKYPRMRIKALQILRLQYGSRLVKGGRRHARGQHHIHRQRKILAGRQHKVYPGAPADVGNLMRIGHHAGGPVGNADAGQIRRAAAWSFRCGRARR